MALSRVPHWRLSSFYFSYFALLGVIAPYWSLYLIDSGLSAVEVSYIAAAMMATKIISPYILGLIADLSGKPVLVVRISSLISLIAFFGIFYADGFLPILLVVILFGFFWNAEIGQFEAITLSSLGKNNSYYGKVRSWGSIGFILAVVGLGLFFSKYSISLLPIVMTFLLAMILLSSFMVSDKKKTGCVSKENSIKKILSNKNVLIFFSVCFLVQVAHGPYYTYFSIYLSEFGFSNSTIGILWAFSVIPEIFMFVFMSNLQQRFSFKAILIISLSVNMIRWSMVALFGESLILLFISQLGHAFTFASFHAISVQWIRKSFTIGTQGQGQALYSALSFGFGGAVGALLSGYLWSLSHLYIWYFAAAIGLMATLLILFFFKEDS